VIAMGYRLLLLANCTLPEYRRMYNEDIVLKTHESTENYLETILILSKGGDQVRAIDIVNELEYSRPSVSVAMKNLREKGLIEIDINGYITLTGDGRQIAESMYQRHTLISDWLMYLGVDKKTAISDACKMEHTMSEISFSAIRDHIETWKREITQNNDK